MNVTDTVKYAGVNDHQVDLFEGQYEVPLGMAYNSYVVIDDKTVVFDTVDAAFGEEWLGNVAAILDGRAPDYLVVQHMEPDHSANVALFMERYPDAKIVASAKAFAMMTNFFGKDWSERRIIVKEGDVLETGKHVFTFVEAPMVHWPEVIVTYDSTDKVLFSADGFGKFGANDVVDPEGWDCEARRYYFGIVGKYGAPVQALLKKAAGLDIKVICPLHGPVLDTPEAIAHAIAQYDTWSSYKVESEGVAIAYTSVYGNTRKAALKLAALLKARGCPKVAVADLARDDMFETVEDAFRYGTLVLATTTYNCGIFPFMHTFITHLTERGYRDRKVAFIENGSWAPAAARVMKGMLEKQKGVTFAETAVRIDSALNAGSEKALADLAAELWP
jgi:flavorubredoxin